MQVVSFVQSHLDVICAFGLFAVSELMALSPKAKSNGIIQWLYSFFKDESAKHPQQGV